MGHIGLAQEFEVSGFVFHRGNPLNSVTITNLSSRSNSITDQNGKYQIEVNAFDTLKFSHVGYHDELRIISKDQFTLNISMSSKPIELDGVTITEKVRKTKSMKELELDYSNWTCYI